MPCPPRRGTRALPTSACLRDLRSDRSPCGSAGRAEPRGRGMRERRQISSPRVRSPPSRYASRDRSARHRSVHACDRPLRELGGDRRARTMQTHAHGFFGEAEHARSPRCRARARRAAPSPRGCLAAGARGTSRARAELCALDDRRRASSSASTCRRTSAITGRLRACASAALTAMRVAHVVNCASPRNCVEVAKHLEPRLLHDIFGFVVGLHDRARRAIQALVVTAYEYFELGAGAGAHARDEFGSGGLESRCGRHDSIECLPRPGVTGSRSRPYCGRSTRQRPSIS